MTLQSRLGRIGRSTPSICGPLLCAVLISCMLSFILILYKPSAGPGEQQRLGWQEWSIIGSGPTMEVPEAPLPPPPMEEGENKPSRPTKPSNDWWENEFVAEPVSYSSGSLPLDQWAPLLPYDTGISEIAITRCYINPQLVDWCYPKSTAEEDAIKGKWVRVERDLNRKTGIYWLHLYYRRTRRLDIPLITDITLLGENQAPPSPHEWRRVDWSIRDGVRGQPPLFLHYKLGPAMGDLTDEDEDNLITELDVLYGDSEPWYGFEKVPTPVSAEVPGRTDSVWLTYRRGVKPPPRPHPPHFSHDGKFKILQVADLHFSVSHGRCIDTELAPCAGDDMTISLLERTLEAEKPDLVVFSGDQLDGGRGSWDSKSVLSKFANTVIKRKIPWAAVLGNHDDETDMSRDEEVRHLQSMPYSLVRDSGNIHGAGNYVVKVRSADSSKTHILTLYFLDSGGYSKGFLDWFGFVPTEYDYIHADQIDWFLAQSEAIAPIHRPFNPENVTAPQRKPDSTTAKPNAIMFFHIPLQETYSTPDIDPATNKALDVGKQFDHNGSAKKNAGMFEKGLMRADDGRPGNMEVKVVANGHCHTCDNCRRVMGLWFCFGGGGSYSGYGRIGFDRRFRVYQISDYGETISTYKRTEDGKIIDEMVLAGKGAPGKYGR